MKYTKPVIIFSDLDGTLLADNHYFSAKTREVVQKLYDQGYFLIPVTARATHDLLEQAKRLKIDVNHGIVAGNNGSQIYDFAAQKWILNEYLPREVVEKVFNDNFNLHKAKVHFFGDAETYVFNEGKNSLYWAQILATDYIVAHSVDAITKPIAHLTIVLKKDTSTAAAANFLANLEKDFGKKIQINVYTERIIELTPKAINKGAAVRAICQYLEIDPHVTKTYAFGDGYNDLALLEAVDVGVAMENANWQLKDIADDITEFNNDQDGVVHYITTKILAQAE